MGSLYISPRPMGYYVRSGNAPTHFIVSMLTVVTRCFY